MSSDAGSVRSGARYAVCESFWARAATVSNEKAWAWPSEWTASSHDPSAHKRRDQAYCRQRLRFNFATPVDMTTYGK